MLEEHTHAQIVKMYYNYLYEASRSFKEFKLCRDGKILTENIDNSEFRKFLQIVENFIEILKYGSNV